MPECACQPSPVVPIEARLTRSATRIQQTRHVDKSNYSLSMCFGTKRPEVRNCSLSITSTNHSCCNPHASASTVPYGLREQKPAQANRQKPANSPSQGPTPNSQIKPAQAPRVPATPHPPSTPPQALLQCPPSHNQQRPTANGGPESEKMSGGGGSRTRVRNHAASASTCVVSGKFSTLPEARNLPSLSVDSEFGVVIYRPQPPRCAVDQD